MQQYILFADVAGEHWRCFKCIYRLPRTFCTLYLYCPTCTVHSIKLSIKHLHVLGLLWHVFSLVNLTISISFIFNKLQHTLPVFCDNIPPMAVSEFGKQGEWGSNAVGVFSHEAFRTQLWTSMQALISVTSSLSVKLSHRPPVLALCADRPLLKSSSLTVFMELCFVVSVVPRLSLRPCKEPRRRAAQPHCAPTTIPELTHLSNSSMSELQIYVLDSTGHQEDWLSHFGFAVFSGSKQLF